MSQLPPQPSNQSNERHTLTLRRLRRLSYVLDSAIRIPGINYRIGLDPIIGLLPGGGDFIGTALSAYIVLEAARLGVPRGTLGQMVSNILFETVTGAVPVLGDFVDVTWKANAKNIKLVEEYLEVPRQEKQKADWLFVGLLLGVLLLVVMAVAAISVMILRWLWGAISG